MSARVHLYRTAAGCVGVIDMPHAEGAIRVTGVGFDFGDALSSAVSVANKIASNPIVSAVLPPQATAALAVVNKLASAAQSGGPQAVQAVQRTLTGPGAQRLATALARDGYKASFNAPERAPAAKHREQMARQRDAKGRADHTTDEEQDDSDYETPEDRAAMTVMPGDDQGDDGGEA